MPLRDVARLAQARARSSYQRNKHVILPLLLAPVGLSLASMGGPTGSRSGFENAEFLKGSVISAKGFCVYPSAVLVKAANNFKSEITLVTRAGKKADLKNVLDILSLAVAKGQKFRIYAEGTDAQDAIKAIADVLSEELRVAEVRQVTTDQEIELSGQPITDAVIIGRALPIKELLEISQFPRIDLAQAAAKQGKTVNEILVKRMDMVVDAFRVMEEELSKDESEIAQVLLGALMSVKTKTLENMEREKICARNAAEMVLKDLEHLRDGENEKFRSLYWDIYNLCAKMLAIKHKKVIDIRREIDRLGRDDVVLVAKDVSPSDVGLVNDNRVQAIVRENGSIKDHLSIRLGDRQRAGLVSLKDAVQSVRLGSRTIVDGINGRLIINPSAASVRKYNLLNKQNAEIMAKLEVLRDQPARTLDGQRVRIMGNAANPEEVGLLLKNGLEGVGLLRTEFFFIYDRENVTRKAEPSIVEQIEFYNGSIAAAQGRELVFRTMDPDKDKSFPYFAQLNNGVGITDKKGLALCLDQENYGPYHYAFRNQLKAMLQTRGRIKVMFPLVRTEAEFLTALRLVDEVSAELETEGAKVNKNVRFGIMVEHPDIIQHLDQLAQHERLSFFSLGTNDLVQFIIRINRYSGVTSRYSDDLDPRVVSAIKQTADIAQRHDVELSLCGDMGNNWHSLLVLLGLGVRKFSFKAGTADLARKIINSISVQDLQMMVHNIESITTGKETRKYIEDYTREQIRVGNWSGLTEIEALLNVS